MPSSGLLLVGIAALAVAVGSLASGGQAPGGQAPGGQSLDPAGARAPGVAGLIVRSGAATGRSGRAGASDPDWADTHPPEVSRSLLAAGGEVSLGAPATRASPPARHRWTWPLDPRPLLTRRFDPPGQRWSAGHRGIDLTPQGPRSVYAVDAGVVTHVGLIAGRPTVSVTHASGIRSTYEPVTSPLSRGARIARGGRLGDLVPAGSHCLPTCLHLGAIRGESYLDPLLLLEPPRIVLLPLDP